MKQSPEPAVIVSVHIPKCAGTSFRLLLESIYQDRLWLNYGTVFTRDDAGPGCVPAGTEAIHGHFFADALDHVTAARQLVTWVRHPVERVVSSYYHFLRKPDLRNDSCRQLHERKLTLKAFAELPWMRNEATRYLASRRPDEFLAVGIVERAADSLALFAQALGWESVPTLPQANLNPDRRGERYALTATEREYLGYLNAMDLAWYTAAELQLDEALGNRRKNAA